VGVARARDRLAAARASRNAASRGERRRGATAGSFERACAPSSEGRGAQEAPVEPDRVAVGLDTHALVDTVEARQVVFAQAERNESVDAVARRREEARIGRREDQTGSHERAGEGLGDGALDRSET